MVAKTDDAQAHIAEDVEVDLAACRHDLFFMRVQAPPVLCAVHVDLVVRTRRNRDVAAEVQEFTGVLIEGPLGVPVVRPSVQELQDLLIPGQIEIGHLHHQLESTQGLRTVAGAAGIPPDRHGGVPGSQRETEDPVVLEGVARHRSPHNRIRVHGGRLVVAEHTHVQLSEANAVSHHLDGLHCFCAGDVLTTAAPSTPLVDVVNHEPGETFLIQLTGLWKQFGQIADLIGVERHVEQPGEQADCTHVVGGLGQAEQISQEPDRRAVGRHSASKSVSHDHLFRTPSRRTIHTRDSAGKMSLCFTASR